jgi:beta-glucosidase
MKKNLKTTKLNFILVLFISLLYFPVNAQESYEGTLSGFQKFPDNAIYQNKNLPAAERAHNVIQYLTFEESLQLVGGNNKFFFPGISRLGLRPVLMSDASQGVRLNKNVHKDEKSTSFPGVLALASTWNSELAWEMGNAVGGECRMLGTDILLGPGINLQHFSVGGRNFEYFGEDPVLVSDMAVNYVKGVQNNKVLATAKHFIGNNQEFCRHITSSDIDERTLREIYLRPWKAVIQKGGVKAIMTGNNAINGVPCSMDKQVVEDIIRYEYGFTGMAMTDWQNTNYYPDLQYLFFTAGVSLLMPNNNTFRNYLDGYLAKYPEKKEEVRAYLNKKVFENLLPLFEMGVFDRKSKDESNPANMEEHKEIARHVAEEAICMLKNEGDFLPLSGKEKVLLAGEPEIYTGKGSGFVKGYDHVNFEDGLRSVFGRKLLVSEAPSNEQIKNADVIIYRLNKEAGEGSDVPFEVGLDKKIGKIAALNPNVIVVISSCNNLPMSWISNVKAVLWSYFLGQERGHALADILVGKINPSGKLPFTMEKDFSDSPSPRFNYIGGKPYWFGNNDFYKTYWLEKNMDGANEQFLDNVKPNQMLRLPYSEGIFTGYRWYEKMNKEVLFPFGYGLSYTQFKYGDISFSKNTITLNDSITIQLKIENIGERNGADVVQLYLAYPESKVKRPVKELKHFKKIFIKKGKDDMLSFAVSPDDLKYWDVNEHKWMIESGKYKVLLGNSSANILSSGTFIFE